MGKRVGQNAMTNSASVLGLDMSNTLPLQIGELYVPVAELGSGGSATVYRCKDASGRHVAVKKYHAHYSEGKYRQRLATEAQHLARSTSPHVVRLLDWGKDTDGSPYLVMELADGCLSDLTVYGAVGIPLAAWITYQAASGLRTAAAIHRDLKPENLLIMCGTNGSRDFQMGTTTGARIVVADWELCKPEGVIGPTKTQDIQGTPVYMSPEQCRSLRDTDKRTDIYSLGIILWELCFGSPPFDAQNPFEIIDLQINAEPSWPKGQPPALIRILSLCLAKAPELRYGSFAALQEDLKPLFSSDVHWTYPPDGPPDTSMNGPIQEAREI